jgi:hypothetical protein
MALGASLCTFDHGHRTLSAPVCRHPGEGRDPCTYFETCRKADWVPARAGMTL